MADAKAWIAVIPRPGDTEDKIALFLEAVFEEGDAATIAAAIGDVARARGMSQIAKDAGLSRENLYRALGADGNPEFGTVMGVIKAMGFDLTVTPHPPSGKAA